MGLKTGDLDDLQLAFKLKSLYDSWVNATTFEPGNFSFKLELCISHLKILEYSKNF